MRMTPHLPLIYSRIELVLTKTSSLYCYGNYDKIQSCTCMILRDEIWTVEFAYSVLVH